MISLALLALPGLTACSQKSRCVTKGVEVEIASDHPHSATVPGQDVEGDTAHTYTIRGESHQHLFMLNGGDMHKLRSGASVETRSTSTNAHAHEVKVRCKD